MVTSPLASTLSYEKKALRLFSSAILDFTISYWSLTEYKLKYGKHNNPGGNNEIGRAQDCDRAQTSKLDIPGGNCGQRGSTKRHAGQLGYFCFGGTGNDGHQYCIRKVHP